MILHMSKEKITKHISMHMSDSSELVNNSNTWTSTQIKRYNSEIKIMVQIERRETEREKDNALPWICRWDSRGAYVRGGRRLLPLLSFAFLLLLCVSFGVGDEAEKEEPYGPLLGFPCLLTIYFEPLSSLSPYEMAMLFLYLMCKTQSIRSSTRLDPSIANLWNMLSPTPSK